MGEQFVNYQVKFDSQADVVKIVKKLSSGKSYVSPPEGGWISIYDEISENYNNRNLYEYIVNFAEFMSGYLNTSVFAFVVFDGVEFFYFLYNNGDLIDEFCDDPKKSFTFGFKKFNREVARRFQGAPEKLLHYCISGTTIENLIEVFNSIKKAEVDYLGDGAIWHLAPLLGMNEYKATQGYKYFENELSYSEEYRDTKDAEKFIFVDCSKFNYTLLDYLMLKDTETKHVQSNDIRDVAYSMDALIPGLFFWIGSLVIRIGGSKAEENYSGTIHSPIGVALVLPDYRIFTTYRGVYDPR